MQSVGSVEAFLICGRGLPRTEPEVTRLGNGIIETPLFALALPFAFRSPRLQFEESANNRQHPCRNDEGQHPKGTSAAKFTTAQAEAPNVASPVKQNLYPQRNFTDFTKAVAHSTSGSGFASGQDCSFGSKTMNR